MLQYQNPGNAASSTAPTQLQLQQLQHSCSSERESDRNELSDRYSAQLLAEGKAHAAAIDALKAQTGANFTCFASTKYEYHITNTDAQGAALTTQRPSR